MAIRETDLMLVCFEASKNLVAKYDQEVNNAMCRIASAMFEAGPNDEVVIERAADNPVERDIAERVTAGTLQLFDQLDRG